MQKMKKLIGFFMALAVIAASMTPLTAFAANTTISVSQGDDHVYDIYQIFTGDYSGGKLTNIEAGANYNANGAESPEAAAAAIMALGGTEREKAAAIKGYVQGDAFETVGGDETSVSVATGYYLIQDRTEVDLGQGDEYTLYIVQVAGEQVTINRKASTVTSEKKVQENSTGDWGETADYEMGSHVPFQLSATITEEYANYESYTLTFHDTLSAGLSFDGESSVSVMVKNGEVETPVNSDYSVTEETDDGCSFHIIFSDLKDIEAVAASSQIIVEYTATLNSNAVVGGAGNPNTMYVQYSNNPNGEGTGRTPEDIVYVFTYQLDGTKVDKDNHETTLSGATFVLKRGAAGPYAQMSDGKITGWVSDIDKATSFTSTENGKFNIIGLDAGTYYLEETVAPEGYNKRGADVVFTIGATKSDAGLTALNISVDGGTATDGTPADGTVSVTVENTSGSTLPSTGGMGTTVLYAAGLVLIAGAGGILIARKRKDR